MKWSVLDLKYSWFACFATVNKNITAALSQCPIVHGEVRGQGQPGLTRVSLMRWEDGVCEDISRSGFQEALPACLDAKTNIRKDAEVDSLRRR